MKRTAFVLLASCFSFGGLAWAEERPPFLSVLEGRYTASNAPVVTYRGPDGHHVSGQRCGTPEPTAAERRWIEARLEESARLFGEPEAKTTAIPVAFHVVHKGGASNVPDSMLEAQIDALNDAFRPHRYSFFIDSIDRTRKSSWFRQCATESGFTAMTNRLSIDPAHTLNIYLCQPGGGILGFAFFPSSFPEDDTFHGVTALYSTLPGGGAFPYDEGATIVHEVGHYLGLFHTFQDGCDGSGDEVSDTPAEAEPAFGCEIGRDTCPAAGSDPVTNFMDYSDDACLEKFTKGQRKRMDQQVKRFRPSLGT